MLKGYWIPHLDVSNMDGFSAYRNMADGWHQNNSSRLLARAGRVERVEGNLRSRNVLREFPSYDAAVAAYSSPEYSRARPLRGPHSVCDFLIVEGYDGAQPAPSADPPAPAALKGYWIAHVDVPDPEAYKPYQAANAVAFSKYGARFIVRGGRQQVTEGKVRSRSVAIEFPSYDAALACYRSPEYQHAKSLRLDKSEADIVVIEQFAGH